MLSCVFSRLTKNIRRDLSEGCSWRRPQRHWQRRFTYRNMYEQLLLKVKEINHGDVDARSNGVKANGKGNGSINKSSSSVWSSRLTRFTGMLFARKSFLACILAAILLLFVLVHMVIYVSKMQVAVLGQSSVCEDCRPEASKKPFPKILHHTWKNSTIPDKWKNSTQSCKALNPDYVYMYWTDRDIENLIEKEYPWFWDTYKNYEYNIQRADAGRYFILYHHGGVYADLDIMCKYPFDVILENVTQYDIVFPQGPPIGVTAEVMIAKPRHPFLDLVVHSLAEADQWRMFPYATIIFSTGPMFMSNCMMKYNHMEQFYIIPYDIYTEKLFINLHGGSWHEWDGDFIFWVYTHKALLTIFLIPLVIGAIFFCKYTRRCCFGNGNHIQYSKVQTS